MTDRIPVTLLTGFLGAGKTTLLNRLLHNPLAGRIAVIVNEYGEAGLEHDLIENVAEDVVLMESGCICCTIRSDLSQTLADLHERLDAGALTFDHVVIETTGVYDFSTAARPAFWSAGRGGFLLVTVAGCACEKVQLGALCPGLDPAEYARVKPLI